MSSATCNQVDPECSKVAAENRSCNPQPDAPRNQRRQCLCLLRHHFFRNSFPRNLGRCSLLASSYLEIRLLIVDSGAIPYLAETLYTSTPDSQENAAATLLNISISCKKVLVSTRGVLDAISHILSNHRSTSSPTAVQSCAATVHSLLVVDEYRLIIGSKRDIMYTLMLGKTMVFHWRGSICDGAEIKGNQRIRRVVGWRVCWR